LKEIADAFGGNWAVFTDSFGDLLADVGGWGLGIQAAIGGTGCGCEEQADGLEL